MANEINITSKYDENHDRHLDISVNGKVRGYGTWVYCPIKGKEGWGVNFMGRDFFASNTKEIKFELEIMFHDFNDTKVYDMS